MAGVRRWLKSWAFIIQLSLHCCGFNRAVMEGKSLSPCVGRQWIQINSA